MILHNQHGIIPDILAPFETMGAYWLEFNHDAIAEAICHLHDNDY